MVDKCDGPLVEIDDLGGVRVGAHHAIAVERDRGGYRLIARLACELNAPASFSMPFREPPVTLLFPDKLRLRMRSAV